MRTKSVVANVAMMLALAVGLLAQEDSNTRMVQGNVSEAGGAPAAKAVVQLKDTKTLQVRSFITQADGAYHFSGLSTNADYEIKAEREGVSSGSKNLSVFDSRKTATVNLKLDKK